MNEKILRRHSKAWGQEREFGYDIVIISKTYFEKLTQDIRPCASETRDLY